MLANILAVLLGLSSFTFYIAAFFYPEVHRRSDILWSGLGLFYAAVLWFSAGQITGVVLLGQLTAVALLLGLGWQTLSIRRAKTPVYQQTPVVITPEVVGTWAKNTVNKLRIAPAEPVPLKLEKRSFKEFSAERIDPRRRPTYDYEFVEDGTEEQFPQSPVLDLEELALEPTPDAATAPAYSAPPSAEAEVIRVESPEDVLEKAPEKVLEEPLEAQAETSAVSIVSNDSEIPEKIPKEKTIAVSDVPFDVPPQSVEKPPLQTTEKTPEAEDWGDFDDALDDSPAVPAKQKTVTPDSLASSKSKPGLLAMPLVLVGWVKDMAGFLTKPKPSKPVIVIPRREPSTKIERPSTSSAWRPAENSIKSPPQADVMTKEPMVTDPPDSNWDDGPESFPEDSNWDD